MTDVPKESQELFSKFREDILRRQLSNTENYDKAVLSLATTFLGFSMAFVKDFTPYHTATFKIILPISWGFFGISIIATIISFFVSQKGLSIQLDYAEKYYLQGDESILTKANSTGLWTERLNLTSAIFFILAVFSTIIFTTTNLVIGGNMSEKNTQMTAKGAGIPGIPIIPTTLSAATSTSVQPVPKPSAPVSSSSPTSNTTK